ncbi:unnamed protein product [Prunus armeniaca]|uniref:Major facilitator superfamily (MFS) profile domain-containing protein n=1 Tax=Prunus armeniaca TaxID=36596 RepID=A0A6J5VA65_PRUAR|nr:unnamed protein product [Prunus armeniaca]
MTLILIGVVSSIGTGFCIEQATHMNHKVGRITVPLPILVWFYTLPKELLGKLDFQIAELTRYGPRIGIICSITAAKMETRRLGVVKSRGLINKPEETVPMSMFWLLPQFLLLGGLEGIAEISVDLFLVKQVPPSMYQCMVRFCVAFWGVGSIGGVLSVYVVGEISGQGGKPSWFQDTLNNSRLDQYYWPLAALSAANLVLYILVSIWYAYKDSRSEDDETAEPFDEDHVQLI